MQEINIIQEIEGGLEWSKSDKKYEWLKRVIDIAFAIVVGIFALPVIIITCILVKLESTGPAIYKQERLGKDGLEFMVYKIRSMRSDAEKNGAQWASKNDDRVTKIGKFIRKTRIDELPQLLNLLRGEMTVVGPRPERKIFTEEFERITPGFKKRLAVKPGLTGLAQVSGGYDLNHKEKLKYDIQYIRNRSLLLDIKIMIKTIKVVFTGEGAR